MALKIKFYTDQYRKETDKTKKHLIKKYGIQEILLVLSGK